MLIRRLFTLLTSLTVLLTVAACGSIAEPEWAVTPEPEVAAEGEAAEITTEEAAPTEEVVAVEPTATTPPTATPTPEPTVAPTEIPPTDAPTETPTEAPTEAAAAGGNGQGQGDGTGDPIADALARGDIANGQTLFNTTYTTATGPWMCSVCHSVDESQMRMIGPGLYGLYERAWEERLPESGEPNPVAYVHKSIVNPGVYMVPPDDVGPYPENMMPQEYATIFTEEELDDLVAYVLSLGNPDAQ
jgi:cytochrome c553